MDCLTCILTCFYSSKHCFYVAFPYLNYNVEKSVTLLLFDIVNRISNKYCIKKSENSCSCIITTDNTVIKMNKTKKTNLSEYNVCFFPLLEHHVVLS